MAMDLKAFFKTLCLTCLHLAIRRQRLLRRLSETKLHETNYEICLVFTIGIMFLVIFF